MSTLLPARYQIGEFVQVEMVVQQVECAGQVTYRLALDMPNGKQWLLDVPEALVHPIVDSRIAHLERLLAERHAGGAK